jgi:uncharacterized protein YwgA
MNEGFDKTKYQHRLIMQKLAYVVKIKDNSLSFPFTWYVRGPYSPELTQQEYGYRGDVKLPITEKDKMDADFVKNLVGEINDDNLELFASVYYIMKTRGIRDFIPLFKSINASKPWFEEKEVRKVFDKILTSDILN